MHAAGIGRGAILWRPRKWAQPLEKLRGPESVEGARLRPHDPFPGYRIASRKTPSVFAERPRLARRRFRCAQRKLKSPIGILLAVALITLSSGCNTTQRNGFSLNEWALQTGFNPQFRQPIAPEVLLVAKIALDQKANRGRWPSGEEIVAAGGELPGKTGEFVRRNVEVRSVSENIDLVVWDLALRKNRLKIDARDKIWIYPEVYGTGSRKRMHATGSGRPDFVEGFLSALGSALGAGRH